jgi:DNA-binding transcriptional LysR family regulator
MVRPDLTLHTPEMWNARVPRSLLCGEIDASICVCPEPGADIVARPFRHEPIAALLPFDHPAADEAELQLAELAGDTFVLSPREVVATLHDSLIALCRRSGFEPEVSYHGLDSGWELEILADSGLVALAPMSVGQGLPSRVNAVRLAGCDELETAIVSRATGAPDAVELLQEVAETLFERPSAAARS